MMKKFKRIYVEITNACNLSCHFCDKTIRQKRHMTSSEYRLVVDKIAPFTDYVYLHVKGEPLLHNELEEILEISKGKVLVNITTNGTLIDKRIDIFRKYKDVINRVNISVHSNFSDEGYLEKILDFCRIVNEEELFDVVIRFWIKESVNVVNRFTETKFVHLSFDEEFSWPNLNKPFVSDVGKCLGTKTHLAVLSNLDVVPCCLDHDGVMVLGNLFNEDLSDIINKPMFQKIKQGFSDRKIVMDLCKHCSYRRRFDG